MGLAHTGYRRPPRDRSDVVQTSLDRGQFSSRLILARHLLFFGMSTSPRRPAAVPAATRPDGRTTRRHCPSLTVDRLSAISEPRPPMPVALFRPLHSAILPTQNRLE